MIRGFADTFRAFGFIFGKGLWYYYLFPVAIWILITWLGLWFLQFWIEHLFGLIAQRFHLSVPTFDNSVLETAKAIGIKGLSWISAIALKLFLLIVMGRINKYLMLILLSPVLALLSEKTEELITGRKFPFSATQLMYEMWRGILITVRNMVYEFFWVIAGLILCLFFPPATLIITPALLLVNSYFMGFSMTDYCYERRKFGIRKSVAETRRNLWSVTGTGLGYNLLYSIPYAGAIVAPVNAVCGAALSRLAAEKEESRQGSYQH